MQKRKTPTEVIESTSNPNKEASFIKTPGRIFGVSKRRTGRSVSNNKEKVKRILSEVGRQTYTDIHTSN